jgi:CRP-like cAMP-binding protein
MAKIKPLKECPLFKSFSDKEIAVISRIVSEKRIPAGTPLYIEGMIGETLFIIKKGSVQTSRNIPGVGETPLAAIQSGEYFGEMALLAEGPREVSARTVEETDFLTIDREDFQEFLKTDALIALRLVQALALSLSEKTRGGLDQIDEFLAWKAGQEKG